MTDASVIVESLKSQVSLHLIAAPEVQALYYRTPAGVMIDPDKAVITVDSTGYVCVAVTGNRILRTGERGTSRASMSWGWALHAHNGGGAPSWIQRLVREYAPPRPAMHKQGLQTHFEEE